MNSTPNWLDRQMYPFVSRFLTLPGGHQLHYIDEGQGEATLFVHGTPTWSFVWREQIKHLSKRYRCVAVDHLGFGLSDKPADSDYYSLEAHRNHLDLLVQHLGLEQVTLVVHDFGGPIGLGWAVKNPEKVARVVILNSWMWPLTHVKAMMRASQMFSGWLGKWLYLRFNFSAKVLLPQAFHQKSALTKQTHRHYLEPFKNPEQRRATWQFAKALAGETNYFDQLYFQRNTLQGKPALVLWGTKDQLIPISFLEEWQHVLPAAQVGQLETGHFLQEEKPEQVTHALENFLDNHPL